MHDGILATISAVSFRKWVLLGLSATAFWSIGGLGALSLLGGLASGSITPGLGSSAASLTTMWGLVILCALGGIILAMGALFRSVPKRVLALNFFLAFLSLLFSVLAD